MRNACLFVLFCLLVSACTPLTQSSTNSPANPKSLRYEDATYEKEIQTVRLFPQGAPLSPAVARVGQSGLMLEFDDMTTERDNYYGRIVHCNFDWTPSTLQDLDFLALYNEFPFNNAEFSIDTHLPYVHYWIQIPPVKLPGNYLFVVYRGSNKEDIVISRRFMVYDMQVSFSREGRLIGSGAVADLNQQINFTINHSNLEILNPMQDVHVTIRQNQRWDNIAQDIRPSFVRDIEKEIEYRFFDDDKMFKGGNEFRFFDIRSLNFPGRNVAFVDKKVKPYEVYIARDKSRRDEAYAQYDEMNGNYIIENYDYRDLAYSNYAYVNFSLQSKPIKGDVFVHGAFNNWALNSRNRMTYDTTQQLYKARILLKQGWYDYQYYVRSPDMPAYILEGSHFQTENLYEIFVYYRAFKPRADLLIGYMVLQENPR